MFLWTITSLFVIANLTSVSLYLTTHIILILFFRATYTLATLAILVVPVCFLQQTWLTKKKLFFRISHYLFDLHAGGRSYIIIHYSQMLYILGKSTALRPWSGRVTAWKADRWGGRSQRKRKLMRDGLPYLWFLSSCMPCIWWLPWLHGCKTALVDSGWTISHQMSAEPTPLPL